MDIEERILKLIKSNKKGILQNKLWKKARIDSSKCSRILAKLEKERKISRETSSEDGVRTYLLRASRNVKEKPARVAGKKEAKPAKVSGKKEAKPARVSGKKEAKPAKVSGKKEAKPARVSGKKEAKPARVSGKKEAKPARVSRKKEEKPAKVSRKKEAKPAKNFRLLLIGDRFSPCTGCVLECVPEQCIPLSEWVYGLEKEGK